MNSLLIIYRTICTSLNEKKEKFFSANQKKLFFYPFAAFGTAVADDITCRGIKATTKVVVCTTPKRGYYWLNPSRGVESSAPHCYLRQPLKRLPFFGLFSPKRAGRGSVPAGIKMLCSLFFEHFSKHIQRFLLLTVH